MRCTPNAGGASLTNSPPPPPPASPPPPRSPPSAPGADAAAPGGTGSKSLVSIIAPVVASVGSALGGFIGLKFLNVYRKTPQGKKLDQLVERLIQCVTCQSCEARTRIRPQ